MTDYILEISFDPELEDIVHGHLFLTRSTGNVTTEPGCIEAYFDSAADRDAAMVLFPHMRLQPSERPRNDWLQLYQQSLQPLFVGHSFVIAPEDSLIPISTERHRLIIPQETAFGTGSHQSTALAVEMLEEIDPRGGWGLDIGSGSGILALTMLRLGARKAIAIDIDLDAFWPLRENQRRNGVAAEEMPLFVGTLDAMRGGRFDVITMNILPEVIVPLLPRVISHLAGALILSGILISQRDDVLAAASDLRLINERTKGEWWAASFQR